MEQIEKIEGEEFIKLPSNLYFKLPKEKIKYLYSVGNDKIIKQWNLDTGECEGTFQEQTETERISCIVNLSEGGRNIVAYGSYDKTVKIFNLDYKYCTILTGHTRNLSSLIKIQIQNFNPNLKTYLLSGAWDQEIRLWDIDEEKSIQTFKGHKSVVTALTDLTKLDRIMFASGSYDKKLKIWEFGYEECLHSIDAHSDYIHAIDSNEEKDFLLSCSSDKLIKVWNIEWEDGRITNVNIKHILTGHVGAVYSVSYIKSKGVNMACSGGLDKLLRIWDIDAGLMLMNLKGHNGTILCLKSIEADSTGVCRVASAGFDKSVIVWNIQTGEQVFNFVGHLSNVTCLST